MARSGSRGLDTARVAPLLALAIGLIAATLLVAAAAQLGASTAHAQQDPAEDAAPLCEQIEELAQDAHTRLRVDLGITLIDLASGESCEVRPTRIFRSASLYKLVVLAEAYRQEEELGLDFEETIELLPRHSLDDPPALQLQEPLEITRSEAIERMITFSGNPSAKALRELLGPGLVALAPVWLGLEQTSLGQIFYTTPRDTGRFFADLYRGDTVSPEASRAMLDLLLRQEINDLIPIGVHDAVAIAHKTGLLERHLHDAGIVFSPAGDYVLVVLTEHQEDIDAAYEAIHALSAVVYQGYATAPPPLLIAPPPAVELPQTAVVVEPTPAPSAVATPVAATPPNEASSVPVGVDGSNGTSGARPLLILGAAGAAALAAVSMIMLIARQRHTDEY